VKTEFGIGDLVTDKRTYEPTIGKVIACKAHSGIWCHTVQWNNGSKTNVYEKDLLDVLGIVAAYKSRPA
jgi:hypothetical protein